MADEHKTLNKAETLLYEWFQGWTGSDEPLKDLWYSFHASLQPDGTWKVDSFSELPLIHVVSLDPLSCKYEDGKPCLGFVRARKHGDDCSHIRVIRRAVTHLFQAG